MSDKLERLPEDVLIDALVEASGQRADAAYEFGEFSLEIDERRLLRNGLLVHLAPKEFDTLRLLVEHHGRLVSKQMLLDHVWTGTFVGDDAITQRICVLRRALGEQSGRARFIETYEHSSRRGSDRHNASPCAETLTSAGSGASLSATCTVRRRHNACTRSALLTKR